LSAAKMKQASRGSARDVQRLSQTRKTCIVQPVGDEPR